MNERIQKLYEQAHVSKETQVRKGGWDNDREPFEFRTVVETVFDPEKFAELIVKECTKVLEIQGSNTGHEQYYYGASLIEERFGVEE